VLFEAVRLCGWLPFYPFPLFAPPSLGNLAGGCLFGIGMVLAGGCVVGVLYKLGGGSVLAAVGLLGLVAGSGVYAELHPWWARVQRATTLHDTAVTLPQLTGTAPGWWAAAALLAGGWLCWRWQRAGAWRAAQRAEGYVPPWQTALVLAGLGLLSVLGTGMPLGVTTSYAKAAAYAEQAFWPAHAGTLVFFTAQPIRYPLPYGGPTLVGGSGAALDVIALIQFPLIAGIVLGALFSAVRLGEFNPCWRIPGRQALMVFAGGVIMALGSRMTPGCNVWHLLGGLPLFSLPSLLFLFGLLPGAWLGGRLLQRLLAA
jgi:hypothetical protein